MFHDTLHYEIRIIDIQSFRNHYLPLIIEADQRWKKTYIPWSEDLEDALDWMFGESLERIFNCRCTNHLKFSEYGKSLIKELQCFEFDLGPHIKQTGLLDKPIKPKSIKFVNAGSILMIFVLYP